MAKIIIDDEEHDIPDGQHIDAVCEDAGIPFSCNSGLCGTCLIDILDGAENLGELIDKEK